MDGEAKSYTDLANKLHEKTVELDVHLRNLTEINDQLKGKCEKAMAALRQLCGSASLAACPVTCAICCNRERTHAILPCGHGGLCDTCVVRVVRRGRCHSCRGVTEGSIRIFL